MGRIYDTATFRALPRERCIVHEILGTECAGPIARHHVHPVSLGGDELGRTVPSCARHHPMLEALARRAYGIPEPRRCRHAHPTEEGRRACERQMNAVAA